MYKFWVRRYKFCQFHFFITFGKILSMKKIFIKLTFLGVLAPSLYYAQTSEISPQQEKQALTKPYREEDNAELEIQKLVKQAQKENKNIILQAGGNWCIWCLRFNNFVKTTPELNKIVDENFLYYHLNFSPKNKNEKVFAKYGNPGEKFGYPVFIILDKNGKQIHTQSSEVFEEGKGYSLEKVKSFFKEWIAKN